MKTIILAFLWVTQTMQLVAQIDSFTVFLVPNQLTYRGTGQIDASGHPLKGNNFGLAGYIFPEDYLGNNCPVSKDCGIELFDINDSLFALPIFPGAVIGRWDFYGYTTQDLSQVLEQGGTATFSTQVFLFSKQFSRCPECKIVTDGQDYYGGDENVPYQRAIVGGTTEQAKLIRGEVEQVIFQQPENRNATGGYNMKVTFRYYKN